VYNEYVPIDYISDDIDILDNKIDLQRIDENIISDVYNQLYELINHRNNMLDKSILLRKQDYVYNNYMTYKYYNIFKQILITLPNVYITFNKDYINDGYMFREKYWITDEFYNENINTVNNKKFIYIINQPILFVLKKDEELNALLELINIRQHKDIILIHSDNDEKYNYKMYYNKMCTSYNIENKLIIVPHK
jgi:hypothetical protein